MKTFENLTHELFQNSDIAMGLVEIDIQIFNIFEEACNIMMPKELGKFFAWFLIADILVSSYKIWDKF